MSVMKRFLIVMLALSSFPFNISSIPVKSEYDVIEITAPEIQEENKDADESKILEEVNEPVEEIQVTDITLSFVGDCTIGSDDNYRGITFHTTYKEVNDPGYFFSGVKSVFEADDYTFINLEGVFTDETKKADKKYRYKGPPTYCEILTEGGIDGCNLANNHTLDYFQTGFDQTVEVLKKANIDYTYLDAYLIKEIKGIKIGFLGYKGWLNEKNTNELLVKHVKEMRDQDVDFIVANYHWGDMYSYTPNAQQRSMAHFAIDNGVDLVVGHHPHVLQGMESYNGKNIVYSLGNFCYGGKFNPEDKDTIIFQQKISFDVLKGEIVGTDYKIIPASISSRSDRNNFQPVVAEGAEAERILNKYETLSEGLK